MLSPPQLGATAAVRRYSSPVPIAINGLLWLCSSFNFTIFIPSGQDFFCLTFMELLDFFFKNCLDFSRSFTCLYSRFYLETLKCDLFGSLNPPTHVGVLISAGESCLGAEHGFISPSLATLQHPFRSQSLQSTCSCLLSSSLSLFFSCVILR